MRGMSGSLTQHTCSGDPRTRRFSVLRNTLELIFHLIRGSWIRSNRKRNQRASPRFCVVEDLGQLPARKHQ
jgi:hypothetical protein